MMPCLRKSMKPVITDRILNDTDLTGQPQAHPCICIKGRGNLGSITYRASVERLKPGEPAQKQAVDIHRDSSEVIFVTFA